MKLRKRFTAWILAGVMAISLVPFPVSRVYAEEMVTEMNEEVLETDVVESMSKSETEGVYESVFKETEIQTEINEEENTDSEHELESTDVQEEFLEEDCEDTTTADKDMESETESDFITVKEDVGDSSFEVFSGSCGENVTFVLDSDGVLTISGSGDMDHGFRQGSSRVPWITHVTDIRSVVITSGVTRITDNAFYGCKNLASVEIPSSVTAIDGFAFGSCDSINAVYIPSIEAWCGINFERWQSNPLYYGDKLYIDGVLMEDIKIPKGVATIRGYAFAGYDSLASVEISEGVAIVGQYAFDDCNNMTRVEFPEGMTKINQYAFRDCSSLTSVNIPSSITNIGRYAFEGCEGLNAVYISDLGAWCEIKFGDVTSTNSYKANPLRYAHNLYINGVLAKDIKIPDKVTSIGKEAFDGCSSLTRVEIPKSVTSIQRFAFYGCCGLTDVFYGGNEEDWAKISIGANNSELTNATIHYNSTMPDIPSIDNISTFTLSRTATGAVNNTINISGEITLSNDIEVSSSLLDAAVKSITWTSSDKEVAEVTICTGTNADDNRSATLYITVTPYKAGTVIITGTTSNGITASCEVTIEEGGTASGIVSDFTLKSSVAGTLDDTIGISGRLKLSADAEVSSDILQKEIDSIQWTTSDPEIAEVTKCVGIKSVDNRTAELMITVTPYKVGTVTITGKSSNGITKECKIIIEPKMILEVDSAIEVDKESHIVCKVTLAEADKDYLESFMKELQYSWKTPTAQVEVVTSSYKVSDDGKTASYNLTVKSRGKKGQTTIVFASAAGQQVEKTLTVRAIKGWVIPDDTWGFENYIVKSIPLDSSVERSIKNGLNASDHAALNEYIHSEHKGQCYGIAVSSLLFYRDILSLDSINGSPEMLYSVKQKENVQSLVGLYYMNQETRTINNLTEDFSSKTVQQQLEIIDNIYLPILLCYSWEVDKDGEKKNYGHAVVGYSVEDGTWNINGRTFQKRLQIYDSNCPSGTENAYLYYNIDSGKWIIPRYSITQDNGTLDLVTDDTDAISNLDFIGIGTSDEYSVWLRYHGNGGIKIDTGVKQYDIVGKSSSVDGELKVSCDYDGDNSALNVELKGLSNCRITPQIQGESLDFSALLNDAYISVDADTYDALHFSDENTVGVNGILGEYSLGLTLDDSPFSADSITISGNNTAEVSAETTKEGVIVRGDNLQNVNVTVYDVNDDTKEIKLQVSSSKDSILIEEEEKKIIVSEDSNDDGIYDKKIADSSDENFEDKIKYKVTFDTQIQGVTTYIDIEEGSTIEPPTEPTAEGYTFTGWYKDVACTTLWDFTTDIVTSDITLYAGWKKYNTDPDTPDNPSSGDVLPDDIPTDGKIPDGLWIAGIQTYTYTGKPIKPEVRVYDSNRLLKAGEDYTISYKNNTKANDLLKESTAPVVIVKGKGNYTGTEKQTFKILPLDLNDTSITTDDISVAYNKKVQKKVPVVTYNGKKLAKNKDFTVSYPSKGSNAYKSAGTYKILLTARQGGNFTGTRTVQFTITNNTLISSAVVKKIANQTYTGKAIEPALEVTMKKVPLVKNIDYTVTYVNNIQTGTATVILTGIGKYAGTKKVTFKINGTSLKGAVVSGITDRVYNGMAQEQKITVMLNNKKLTEETDYKVVYSKNVNVGNATVMINGINAYSGTIKKTFKITAYDLEKNTGHAIGGLDKEIKTKYLKGGSKPKLELTFAGRKLAEGIDYTISYQHNKSVTAADIKNKPFISVKGRGNFKGNLTKTFTITGKALNDTESPVTLTVMDKGFVDKPGKYVSVPILTDADGKKLAAGKDYESEIIYTLENGTELTKKSKVNAGTKVKVKVTGKGAYNGQLEGVYQITKNDFSKAKVSVKSQSYTGKAVTLDKDSVIVRVGKETLVYGTDYEIVEKSYANNIEKGTASVEIVGKRNYGGTKKVKFKITPKSFSWFWRLFG